MRMFVATRLLLWGQGSPATLIMGGRCYKVHLKKKAKSAEKKRFERVHKVIYFTFLTREGHI